MKKRLVPAALAIGLALGASSASRTTAVSLPNDDRTIAHVLNRIAFGPRPGDIARIRATGLDRYIDQQLHPDRLPDRDIDTRLSTLTTLRKSAGQISSEFEQPLIEMRQQRQLANASSGGSGASAEPSPEMRARNNQLVLELSQQKILRAIYSERQLSEVMVDFWFNHFNVDARKGRDRFLLTAYERDAIRPHVLGRFRDLLEATAKSPAMLFYLDNWMSADPDAATRDPRAAVRPVNPRRRGLNENYARELMELHTLGVDGGYSQKDVTEVARAFTGWTIGNPRQGRGYFFDARVHDRGEKLVLGHRIQAGGGEDDGERVLDILASHPSAARFVATKLVRRFVSDTPPAALVARAAASFSESGGDIRDVLQTIFTAPEFLAPEAYRAKVKTPFEFIVSAMRATDSDVQDAVPLVRAVQQLGMPLYACQPPTGYKDTAETWINTGALVQRMNLALALASNRMRGVTLTPVERPAGTPEQDTRILVNRLLNGDVSESTWSTIGRATTAAQTIALSLGSPEFQKR
jgi:uncharacterized protein (DUF1800 family)